MRGQSSLRSQNSLSGRQIYLRRAVYNLRVTIRPGTHEILGAPAFDGSISLTVNKTRQSGAGS